MSALGRAQRVEAFQHVTQNIMLQEETDTLIQALALTQIDNITGLLTLNKQSIETLQYIDNGSLTSLDPGSQNEITIFIAYLCHRIRTGIPVGNNYLSITPEDYNKYHISEYMLSWKMIDPAITNKEVNMSLIHI